MVTGVTEDTLYKLGELEGGGIGEYLMFLVLGFIRNYSCYSSDRTNEYLLDNAKIPIQL